jgi:hypothetical protein
LVQIMLADDPCNLLLLVFLTLIHGRGQQVPGRL